MQKTYFVTRPMFKSKPTSGTYFEKYSETEKNIEEIRMLSIKKE